MKIFNCVMLLNENFFNILCSINTYQQIINRIAEKDCIFSQQFTVIVEIVVLKALLFPEYWIFRIPLYENYYSGFCINQIHFFNIIYHL